MKTVTQAYDVGVIVGRFQVPELHEAHIDLINSVLERHSKTIIVLGLSPLPVTKQNPLDFQARLQMLTERFPTLVVIPLNDQPSDELWSKRLDQSIEALVSPGQTVALYGSRDSFIRHYHGRYDTVALLQESYISGTETRKQVAAGATVSSVDFRRGVVWASTGRFPVCYPTVDVAVLDQECKRVLLARKPGRALYQFIGGFADPSSPSFEADARREVSEEAHIEITYPVYIGSFPIDDWRYRGEVDQIKTSFFGAKLLYGQPRADDDIEEVRWFDLPLPDAPVKIPIFEGHRLLLKALIADPALKGRLLVC